MKKINTNHDNKDRIICVSELGKHKFYYQPVGTKERFWLFDTKNFSGSVFAFFRKYGRCLDGIGFSMTVRELHEAGNGHKASEQIHHAHEAHIQPVQGCDPESC